MTKVIWFVQAIEAAICPFEFTENARSFFAQQDHMQLLKFVLMSSKFGLCLLP